MARRLVGVHRGSCLGSVVYVLVVRVGLDQPIPSSSVLRLCIECTCGSPGSTLVSSDHLLPGFTIVSPRKEGMYRSLCSLSVRVLLLQTIGISSHLVWFIYCQIILLDNNDRFVIVCQRWRALRNRNYLSEL